MKPAVLFDLGNTLAAYYRPEEFRPILEDAIAGVLDELRLRGLSNSSLEAVITAAIEENREAGDFSFRPMAERLGRIFAIPVSDDQSLAHALSSRFLRPIFDLGRLYDDALPALDELRRAGYPTAIVSNAPWGSPPELWRQELRRLGLAPFVDAVVLCGDVGWRKPARVIFEHAAAKLDRTCANCTFIGDDLRWDIDGSASVGMRSILIDRDQRNADYKGERICDLKTLLALVDASA
jgi:putative hydrolase of the HAD superfamily